MVFVFLVQRLGFQFSWFFGSTDECLVFMICKHITLDTGDPLVVDLIAYEERNLVSEKAGMGVYDILKNV